ncbi:MAG: EamA family transporter [Elusimicrobia bacterium]|nr:EamA family transporter [Elusimicrobiota bacterium]
MTAYTYALLAALIWGIAPIFEKVGLTRNSPLVALTVRSMGVFIGALLLLPAVPHLRSGLRAMDWWSILSLLGAGILGSIAGQIFAYNAMKKAEVSQVSPVMASWPLLVFLFGWLFLGEAITLKKLVGSGLIVLGVWLLRF